MGLGIADYRSYYWHRRCLFLHGLLGLFLLHAACIQVWAACFHLPLHECALDSLLPPLLVLHAMLHATIRLTDYVLVCA